VAYWYAIVRLQRSTRSKDVKGVCPRRLSGSCPQRLATGRAKDPQLRNICGDSMETLWRLCAYSVRWVKTLAHDVCWKAALDRFQLPSCRIRATEFCFLILPRSVCETEGSMTAPVKFGNECPLVCCFNATNTDVVKLCKNAPQARASLLLGSFASTFDSRDELWHHMQIIWQDLTRSDKIWHNDSIRFNHALEHGMKMLRGRTMATGAALDCLFAICIQGDVLVPESEQKANNELLTFVYFCRILSHFVAFWSLRTDTRPSSKASDSRQMK
jgi:hypothetical protein